MGIVDLILFPFYVFIFNLIFSARRKRIKDPVLQKYHKRAFWIKIMSTLAFTFLCVYFVGGDTLALYYPEGVNIAHLTISDPSNIKWIFLPAKEFDSSLAAIGASVPYFTSEGNFFVIRLVALFSFFSFGSYLVINLFFAMLAFSGIWRLYKFFYEQYPHLHKRLAIAILYLPTFVFWTSGILKEPICIAALGWLTYAFFNAFHMKKSFIKNVIIIIVGGFVLYMVKAYILFAYLPFFILFIVVKKVGFLKNKILKFFIWLVFILVGLVGFVLISDQLQQEMGSFALENLTDAVAKQQTFYKATAEVAESSFSLGVEYDGSKASLVKMAPAAIAATFFRPFLWESKKISTLFSSFESLAMMLLTIYVFFRVGPLSFLRSLLGDPMVFFCFFFSILFALFVGATTLNFGTLVRYKVPCLPFYIIAMFLILDNYNRKKLSVSSPPPTV